MKNILLVDDDNISNLLSRKMLERLGYTSGIHTATNGKEALELFNDYFQGTRILPDIILLDLNMPIIDGFGFLEAFSKLTIPQKETIKIIIVTSSENPDDIARAKTFGIEKYLTKPLREELLIKALN